MKKTVKKKIKEDIIWISNANSEERKVLIEVAMAGLAAGRLAVNAERAKLNALGILEVPKDEKKLFDGSLARKYKKARDAATTAEELERLSKDDDDVVRYSVAGNSNTCAKTLERLSDDTENFVRFNVVENPHTSKEILEKLANDDDKFIKNIALKKLKIVLRKG